MISKRLEAITFEDIEALVTNSVPESRSLDYKRELPGTAKDDAREFLADITSLANTNGGDLVFGIEEQQGIPTAIVGLAGVDRDKDVLRLEQLLASSVDPRIAGVGFRWVVGPAGDCVLVARAPASMNAPHRVTHTGHDKFYARHSKGKYPMDTHELRLAFTASEGLPARLRALHERAREYARGNEFPLRLASDGPAAVLSVMPLSVLRQPASVPVDPAHAVLPALPLGANFSRTLEGIVSYNGGKKDGTVLAWSLLHQAGRLDAAWQIGRKDTLLGPDTRYTWPHYFETGLVDQCTAAKSRLAAAGVEGPWVVFVTVEWLKGFHLETADYSASQPSWHSVGTLADLVVEDLNADTLKPIADQFWLLFGQERPDKPFPIRG